MQLDIFEHLIMVRNRKEKRKIGDFDEESMKRAVLNVIDNEISIRAAAQEANLVHMTLKRYVDKYRNSSEEERLNFHFAPRYDVNKEFPKELEDQLRDYLLTSCRMHHGLTRKNAMMLAYELAKINNLKYPSSWDKNRQAGVD
ncbi:hypothetical protein NQ314_020330 [Rhamnusium bicolor]|uniref:Transposase n=1 Tax=Rhamnusium bicolor TaxID=1586634 RepID=A0AAV8WL32_9CUCU|nr:hypothetical protein NQ314_020330 [Rhamnusium bicolor]